MAQSVVGLRLYPNSCCLMIRKLVQWRRSSFFTPSCNLSLFAESSERSQVAAAASTSKAAQHLPISGSGKNTGLTWIRVMDYQLGLCPPSAWVKSYTVHVDGDGGSLYSPVGNSQAEVLDDMMVGYLFGKKKATEVAHLVWRQVVQKGDALVDASCGNGYDTLAMVKMIADNSYSGHVYSMDVQKVALESTSALLNESLAPEEKRLVELFAICHSKMEEVVPKGVPVRLVAFNLGYLPGSDKAIITRPETTLQALEAARRLLAPGGLISIVVYIGHPGGREELEAIQGFAAALPVESWICSKLQMLNRPLAPILLLLFKR